VAGAKCRLIQLPEVIFRHGFPGIYTGFGALSLWSVESAVNDLLYRCRGCSTNRPLLFKTKPIFRKARMSVSCFNKKGYENLDIRRPGRSKPKQSQFKPKPMLRWVSFCGLRELGPAMCSAGGLYCTLPPNETLGAGYLFSSLVDDVKIYNRALSEERDGELVARSTSRWLANGIVRCYANYGTAAIA